MTLKEIREELNKSEEAALSPSRPEARFQRMLGYLNSIKARIEDVRIETFEEEGLDEDTNEHYHFLMATFVSPGFEFNLKPLMADFVAACNEADDVFLTAEETSTTSFDFYVYIDR